jgi:hypothetical protein
MAHESLEQYLSVLGPYVGLPLKADDRGVCRIALRDGLACQIESPLDGSFQLTSVLGELPAGRYKQQALQAALRTNGATPPPMTTLAFSAKRSALILQLLLPAGTQPEILCQRFTLFLEQALTWQDALRAGGGFPEPPPSLESAFSLHPRR